MQKFTDSKDDAWSIDLTVGLVMQIRKRDPRLDLFDMKKDVDGKPLAEALQSEGLFFELLWYLVEEQAEGRGISAVEFGKRVAAACIADAMEKFFLEWLDFFRGLRRPEQVAPLEKLTTLRKTQLELMRAKMEDPTYKALDEKMRKATATALNDAFAKWEASLELTRGDTTSADLSTPSADGPLISAR